MTVPSPVENVHVQKECTLFSECMEVTNVGACYRPYDTEHPAFVKILEYSKFYNLPCFHALDNSYVVPVLGKLFLNFIEKMSKLHTQD